MTKYLQVVVVVSHVPFCVWAALGYEGNLVSAAKASAPSPDRAAIVEVEASVALSTADGSHNEINPTLRTVNFFSLVCV